MSIENIFDHIPASAACIDKSGGILTVNKQWRIYAESASAPSALVAGVGLNYLHVCDNAIGRFSEYGQLAATGIRQVISGERMLFEMEYACHTPTALHWAILQVFPLDEDSSRFAILHIPITSTKLREELAQQEHKLASLGLLSGGVAHDINNLLQIVSIHLSLTKQKLTPDSSAHQSLEKATHALEQIAALSTQMLIYSGGDKIVREALSLNAIIEENLPLIRSATAQGMVELTTDLAPDLPSILGDRSNMLQLLMNLVLNAIEATKENADGRVFLSTTQVHIENEGDVVDVYTQRPIASGSYVLLTVSDNNGGIPASIIKSIFDPFFTTKTGTRGLGLSVVMGIVRNHDGVIQVISDAQQGARFLIYLPIPQQKS